MRVQRLTAIALVLSLAAPGAVLAWPGGEKKLPQAIDSPVVRPRVRDDHKVGLRGGRHPSRLGNAQWGRNNKWLMGHHSRPMAHYLK